MNEEIKTGERKGNIRDFHEFFLKENCSYAMQINTEIYFRHAIECKES